jgi:hypothetical protein
MLHNLNGGYICYFRCSGTGFLLLLGSVQVLFTITTSVQTRQLVKLLSWCDHESCCWIHAFYTFHLWLDTIYRSIRSGPEQGPASCRKAILFAMKLVCWNRNPSQQFDEHWERARERELELDIDGYRCNLVVVLVCVSARSGILGRVVVATTASLLLRVPHIIHSNNRSILAFWLCFMLQIVSPKGQIFVGIERSDIHGFVLI